MASMDRSGEESRIRPPVAQGVKPHDNCSNCDNCFVDYGCDVSDLAQATLSVTQTRYRLDRALTQSPRDSLVLVHTRYPITHQIYCSVDDIAW